MSNLPILSGKEIIKILEKFGYNQIRQRGSHIRMTHIHKKSVTVPNHKSVGRGLLKKILRTANILPKDFSK